MGKYLYCSRDEPVSTVTARTHAHEAKTCRAQVQGIARKPEPACADGVREIVPTQMNVQKVR